eukprot:TRINITY_DN27203_c0_g1_i1.p1 TRINITY_DN27203_c0_g1~~TRINITY_DN27203_c0_g1_i1.p1  ORF type:complete len:264 (-),score=13.04 TRINITY_DN27203_c0_g1_i1:117-908(-)
MDEGRFPDELLVHTVGSFLSTCCESDVHSVSSSHDVRIFELCRINSILLSTVSQCSGRCWRAIQIAQLWRNALRIARWPMHKHVSTKLGNGTSPDKRALQLNVLRSYGIATRRLHIDCHQLLPDDMDELVFCCPSVAILALSCYGPEGTFSLGWVHGWCQTLRCLSIHFWYDDCLGGPQICILLKTIGATCEVITDLYLRGVDYPRAKTSILRCFDQIFSRRNRWSLQRLFLEGSEPWSPEDLGSLRNKGIRVHWCPKADRGR